MSYNDLEIEVIFDRIWKIYPRKDKPAAAKKALTVALRSGHKHKDIENAVEIYCMESKGDEFHYYLSNFILDDHWKDIIDHHKDVDGYKRNLQKQEDDARKVIEKWNEACRNHWCKVIDIEARIPLAKKALQDETFKHLWEKALDDARKIFVRSFRDGDKFSNLSLTIRWFCTTTPEKHTVARVLEGEYGKPYNETVKPPPKELKPLSDKEKDELKNNIMEIFGDDFLNKPSPDDDFDFELE